jgi:hypothetical protein
MSYVTGAVWLMGTVRRERRRNATNLMNQLTRRQIWGILLISGVVLIAAAFQSLGPGFVRSVHPATPPEVADQGGQVTGGVRIAVLPIMLLALLGIAGLRLLISPREEGNRAVVKRTSALLMLLATVMVAGFGFLLLIGRPSPLPIAVAHVGFTNGPAGARLAVFTVANRGRNPIERDREYWIEGRQDPGHPTTTPPFPCLPA